MSINSITKITLKLFVREFYKRNSGFFFLFFLLCFGIIPPHYLMVTHYALIKAQMGSFYLIAIVTVIWWLYSYRGLNFVSKTLSTYWDSVLHIYQGVENKFLMKLSIMINLLLVFPVLVYAGIAATIGLIEGNFIYFGYVILICLSIVSINTYSVFRKFLRVPEKDVNSKKWMSAKLQKYTFYTLVLNYFWSEKKGILVSLKVLSYLGFHLFILRNEAFFRIDYFTIFLLLIGFFNSLLILSAQKMKEEYGQFIRNLPIAITNRWCLLLVTGIVLYLPELIYLLGMNHLFLPLESKFALYLLLVSQFVLLFALLYTENFRFWKFMKYNFIIFLGYQVLVALISPVVIVLLNFTVSFFMFYEGYVSYEHDTSQMKEHR